MRSEIYLVAAVPITLTSISTNAIHAGAVSVLLSINPFIMKYIAPILIVEKHALRKLTNMDLYISFGMFRSLYVSLSTSA